LCSADRYSVNAPAYVNDVATGIVRLEGEVVRPGEYLVARDETLQQLIERAGGLTRCRLPTRRGLHAREPQGKPAGK
jgi:protein involved in polysaccharide export with SLBB domain